MNELTIRESAAIPDEPSKDYYCWQYVNSLAVYELGFWHGRLIGLSSETDPATKKLKPFKIKFFDKEYSEDAFREKLSKGEISIVKFELDGKPTYKEGTKKGEFVATGTANIVARVDGELVEGKVKFRHKIRPTFLSYDTEIKL